MFARIVLRLCAIYGVKGLVEEEADGPACVDPARTFLVEGRVVVEKGEQVSYDEAEA